MSLMTKWVIPVTVKVLPDPVWPYAKSVLTPPAQIQILGRLLCKFFRSSSLYRRQDQERTHVSEFGVSTSWQPYQTCFLRLTGTSGVPLNFFLGSNKTALEDGFGTMPEMWRNASSSSARGLMRAHIVVSETSFGRA